MKTKRTLLSVLALAAALAAPTLVAAGAPVVDSPSARESVQDSAITAAVKTKLAAEQVGSLTHLKVDTDQDGIVWLSGTTRTQEAADRAVESARNADGVIAVKSTIVVAPEIR